MKNTAGWDGARFVSLLCCQPQCIILGEILLKIRIIRNDDEFILGTCHSNIDEAHGIRSRVLDLRWLNPLPTDAIREEASRAEAVLVVDECRATGGGVADAIIADLAEHGFGRRLSSVRAVDSFVPLGTATSAVLVGLDQILAAALTSVPARTTA